MNKLKRISLITLCSIMILATVTFAKTGIVNAPSGLVLREDTSKSSNPITTVEDKSKVEILNQNGEWYKVKYNNNEGYLFAEYVNVEEEKEPEETEEPKQEENQAELNTETATNSENNTNQEKNQYPQKQKAKSNLKVYTIPSVTANTIVSVKKDEEITVNYELNNWINITYKNKTGWARKYFIQNENKTEKTNTDNKKEEQTADNKSNNETLEKNTKGYVDVTTSANIRKEANTSSEIVDTLLRNAQVTITGEEGDFYKIQYNEIAGYISKSLISEQPLE